MQRSLLPIWKKIAWKENVSPIDVNCPDTSTPSPTAPFPAHPWQTTVTGCEEASHDEQKFISSCVPHEYER